MSTSSASETEAAAGRGEDRTDVAEGTLTTHEGMQVHLTVHKDFIKVL